MNFRQLLALASLPFVQVLRCHNPLKPFVIRDYLDRGYVAAGNKLRTVFLKAPDDCKEFLVIDRIVPLVEFHLLREVCHSLPSVVTMVCLNHAPVDVSGCVSLNDGQRWQ
jgi:hypothetical protein